MADTEQEDHDYERPVPNSQNQPDYENLSPERPARSVNRRLMWIILVVGLNVVVGLTVGLTIYFLPDKSSPTAPHTELEPSDAWAEWGTWSACNESCGGGTRSRERECTSGGKCTGHDHQAEPCSTQPCPGSGVWAEWGTWGACNESCGGGTRSRERECTSGGKCTGHDHQAEPCSTQPCPGSDAWAEWGTWSACNESCGGGTRSRERECTSGGKCTGHDHQAEPCSTQPCPGSVLSVWTSWGLWTSCSLTCGSGSQTRQRTCPGQGCSGDAIQHRDCPDWACPDCDAACPGGGDWNSECTWCSCSGDTLTGRVLTTFNTPLTQVELAPAHAPYHIVATTDAQGLFSVPDVCVGQDLLVTKSGFVDQTYTVLTLATAQISLLQIEPLSLVREPEDKMRITGETAVLCCEAVGSPPPTYYEWFKDGEVILVDVTSGESSLVLENVDGSSSGEYRCRASNDVSAIYSHVVRLEVKEDSSGFCSPYPQSHRVALDPSCKSPEGAQAYDVGKCETWRCRQQQENQTRGCEDEETFCCGPTSFARVDLDCEDVSDFIYVVTSCGCTPCGPGTLTVRGQLLAADTAQPVAYGKVQLQGKEPAWADGRGQFTLTVPQSQQRVAITATDISGEMVQTIKVVSVRSQTSTVRVTINMLRKAPSVSFSASEETVLGMGEEHGEETFAGLHFPPQSVYAVDGSVYTGEVRASLNVIDPRNMTDVLNAPSDFSFVDQEGEAQALKTFGMFNLQMEDPSGNPLQAQGDLELFLDASLVGTKTENLQGDDLPAIWVLDTNTGRWVKLADMTVQQGSSRFKRQSSNILVGNVNISYSGVWCNYDVAWRPEACISNVRVYKTNAFIDEVNGGSSRPYALVKDGLTYQVYSTLLATSNGYCLAHPCDVVNDEGYEGYVMVSVDDYWRKFTEHAFPVNDTITADQGIKDAALKTNLSYSNAGNAISIDFSYRKQQSDDGPFYLIDDQTKCEEANQDDNHFKFYISQIKAECTESENTKTLFPEDIDSSKNLLAWYNDGRFVNEVNSAVFIKVTTYNSKPVMLRADSKVGNTSHVNSVDPSDRINPGDLYGYREACIDDQQVVCLELKPSGYVSRSKSPNIPIGTDRDETWVAIYTHIDIGRDFCTGYRINDKLNEFVGHPTPNFVNHHRFEMRMSKTFENDHTHESGVYWGTGNDIEEVRNRVKEACLAGINPTSSGEGTNKDNSALEFFCE